MAIHSDEFSSLLQLIKADVAATLGPAYESHVMAFAEARILDYAELAPGIGNAALLVSDVQQMIHDEHIDTVWPPCPIHPYHPMWIHEGSWCCAVDQTPMAAVGNLESLQRR